LSKKFSEYEELSKAVERIRGRFRVYSVILFGSRAREDYKPWSDYDILIVGDFKERYLDRIKMILEVLDDVKLPIEPHPYTLAEAREMLRKGNPTIVDALSEGIVLYEVEEFKELRTIYEDLVRRGLRRSETSIIMPSSTKDSQESTP